MNDLVRGGVCFALLAFFGTNVLAVFPISFARSAESPRLFILNPADLHEAKKRLENNDPSLLPALGKLKRDADRALAVGQFAVTHKELTPPSGDRHDYLSIAPYWWPNPNTSSGLPYVRRDGEVNPERDQTSDRKRLDNL
ncbi:MAG: alginate lyase family protein, partial [Candidatus Binatia bacterium]